MIKIIITRHREKELHEFKTELESLTFLNKLIDEAIEVEEEYLDDMDGEDPEAIEKIKELESLNRSNIHELEWNAELILGEYAEVEIEEYDYYITDLLNALGFNYDKSTVSKSIYVKSQEGLLIRISDHQTPGISKDYGHRIPDIELIYKDGAIDNKDINKYLGTKLENEIILL